MGRGQTRIGCCGRRLWRNGFRVHGVILPQLWAMSSLVLHDFFITGWHNGKMGVGDWRFIESSISNLKFQKEVDRTYEACVDGGAVVNGRFSRCV